MRLSYLLSSFIVFPLVLGSWFSSPFDKTVEEKDAPKKDFRNGVLVLFNEPKPSREDITKLSSYITSTLEANIIQTYDSLFYGFAVEFDKSKLQKIYTKIAEMNNVNEFGLDDNEWLNEQISKLFVEATGLELTILENSEVKIDEAS